MNSAFGGYEELSRSRPSASVDNTLRSLLNSSYPTQPHSLIANYIYLFTYIYPGFARGQQRVLIRDT